MSLLAAVVLPGCAGFKTGWDGNNPPPLLISPSVLGEHTLEQRLTIQWPGASRTLDTVTETSGERLTLIVTAFGMRMMSVEWDGRKLVEKRVTSKMPKGARILNDFFLASAPEAALKKAIPGVVSIRTKNVFTAPEEDAGSDDISRIDEREIIVDGKRAAHIRYTRYKSGALQKIELSRPGSGYTLIIDSHEL